MPKSKTYIRASRTRKEIDEAIQNFKEAVEAKAFEGTIPYFSRDTEEQKLLDITHQNIASNYVKAELELRRLML